MEISETLVVAALAALPGALYTWAFEQWVGAWRVRTRDRILRFLGTAAVFHALFAPAEIWLWARFIGSGRVGTGDVPLGFWIAPLLYVGFPTALGSLIGRGTKAGKRWSAWFTGRTSAPRAWDHFFFTNPDGWVRLKLRSGGWIGGAFARTRAGPQSYAAGYPEPQDLWIAEVVELDGQGNFVIGPGGEPVRRGSGILITWDEVELLEFFDA